jgi:SAM-dependent methyltransferase
MNGDESTMHCAACANRVGPSSPPHEHHAHHNGEKYTLQRCPACDLQFWSPLKADPSVYAGEGFEAYVDYHSGTRPFPRWAEPLFRLLSPQGGRALDIGCGDGAVLRRLADAGYDPHGIDLDEKSVAVARDKFGLGNVAAMTLDAFEAECHARNERFDLITFFEVLEHQDAPRAFLAQVMRLGEPGGRVAGSVPNRDRFLAPLDRKLSDGDLPPHHFLWFSSDSLAQLLARAGLQDVRVTRIGALSYPQIVGKLNTIISRKASALPAAIRWTAVLLKVLAPLAAVIPWLGMRAAPSHLFFECRVPSSRPV